MCAGLTEERPTGPPTVPVSRRSVPVTVREVSIPGTHAAGSPPDNSHRRQGVTGSAVTPTLPRESADSASSGFFRNKRIAEKRKEGGRVFRCVRQQIQNEPELNGTRTAGSAPAQ